MWKPNVVVVHPEAAKFPLTQTVLSRLPDVPFVQAMREEDLLPYLNQKKTLVLRPIKGALLKACPGTSTYRC